MDIISIRRRAALWLALAFMLSLTGVAEGWPDSAEGLDIALDVEYMAEANEVPEAADEVAPDPGEEAPGDAAETPGATAVRLASGKLKLGLKEKRKLALEGGVSPKSVGAVFSSSKSKVASVNRTTGQVTAKRKGEATITMKTADGSVSACKITVVKAPSRVKLSSASLTLGVGEEDALKARLSSGSASKVSYSSSNKKVARVDGDGHIVALKKGVAKITARTFNDKEAVCRVTVKAAPKSVSFAKSSISLWNGDSCAASPILSKNSAGAYTLTSDNEAVVAVSGGKLKAVGVGTATVAATTYNGLTASLTVEVCRRPVYRALLVGESTFPGTRYCDLPAKKDVSLMKNMLKKTQGAAQADWQVTTRTDRTTAQIYDDIQTAFAGAREGDVSLFYISTHGDQDTSFADDFPEYAGFLVTYPDSEITNWYDQKVMTLPCLASWLKQVPGQVIVIIDSCGSGAAVYGANGKAAASPFSAGKFDEAVVNAFEAQDGGAVAPSLERGAFVVKNKFYVLTSAGYQEACWTYNGRYSYFTKWLTDGVGVKGSMPADANKNRRTTLKELYKYIKKRGDKTVIPTKSGGEYRQHVQVYPASSGFELFYR